MKTNKYKSFGKDWSDGELSFPSHLTPEIIHSALFVYNAPKEEVAQRVEHCAKLIGDRAMSFAMALLVLPDLQKMVMKSDEYQEWQQTKRKLN